MSRTSILKISVTIGVFLLFIPLLQSLFFQNSTNGKISIDREIEIPFLPYSDKKFSLIFFGYYGCGDVCTPFLQKLSTIYDSEDFDIYRREVDIYFINLNPEVKKHNPDEFAKYFNKDFKGIYLTRDEIMSIDRGFGLYHTTSLTNKGEINHTDNLYLIERDGKKLKLKEIYFSKALNSNGLTKNIKRGVETSL